MLRELNLSKAHLSPTFHDGFKSYLAPEKSLLLYAHLDTSIYFTFIFVNLTRILFPSLQSLQQNPQAKTNHHGLGFVLCQVHAVFQHGKIHRQTTRLMPHNSSTQGKARAGEFWHPESKTYQEKRVGLYTFLGLKLTFQ